MMQRYVIRGGAEGLARLDTLARVLWPTTQHLLQRAGIVRGMRCLDLGCGGGHVSLEMARLVGAEGRVLGIDMDTTKLELARQRAKQHGLRVTFERANVHELSVEAHYDVVYARFLLTHLPEPADVVQCMLRALRPGGVMIVEDIQISASFAYPASAALARHVEWYEAAVERRGGDPNIGPKLPSLLRAAGIEHVQLSVVQPSFLQGEGKTIHQLTMENIAATVIGEGLATQEEVEHVTSELALLADDPDSLVALPRIFQVWGLREG
jgi:ubiquinone/menaquinone biosynthesis C-methylase UbiE